MVRCIRCGFEDTAGSAFCKKCGTKLEYKPEKMIKCGRCGAENKEGSKFCKRCGMTLEYPPKEIYVAPKPVTFAPLPEKPKPMEIKPTPPPQVPYMQPTPVPQPKVEPIPPQQVSYIQPPPAPQAQYQPYFPLKSLSLAVIASFFIWGSGHIYTKRNVKGAVLIVAEIILLIILIISMFTVAGYILAIAIMYWLVAAICVSYDSYECAKEYNIRLTQYGKAY